MLINVLLRHLHVQPHRTSTHIHVLSGIRARDPVFQSPRPYVPLRLYSHCHQQKLNTTVQLPVYRPHLIDHLSESLVIPTISRYCSLQVWKQFWNKVRGLQLFESETSLAGLPTHVHKFRSQAKNYFRFYSESYKVIVMHIKPRSMQVAKLGDVCHFVNAE